jgi:hypothetical protein
MKDLLEIIIITILIIILLIGGACRTGRYFDKRSCYSFGQQSGRETKFVDYTFFSWDCLTPTTDNKWISIDNLRDIVE